MPNEFTQLRTRARERRDSAMAQIRAEYEETLKQIAELEQRISGRPRDKKMNLQAAVESCIPRSEPFTIADVMRALEALDPGRVWCKVTVVRHVTKLRSVGLVQRIKRHQSNNRETLYQRCDGKPEPTIQDKRLVDVVAEVVTKPMRTAEVVLAVLDTGWQTTMIPGHFRTHVISRLKLAGFVERGGKWVR